MPNLKDFQVLTFDVYGTLINWEDTILAFLQPLLDDNNASSSITRPQLLSTLDKVERAQQLKTPSMPYPELLSMILPHLAAELNLTARPPTAEECSAFGASIATWPAFPDAVSALHRLQQHFKLVVLSNVDRASFSATNALALSGVNFDLVLTAEDIGSYKPDPRNFEYMLREVHDRFGVGKEGVIQTAVSQHHDCRPARRMGYYSCWIRRPGSTIGGNGGGGKAGDGEEIVGDWQFDTLGDMADALEAELAEAK